MKLTIKILTFSLLSFILTGCGSKFYHFEDEESNFNKDKSSFNIKKVDVALHNYDTKNDDKKISYYSSDEKLAELIKTEIIKKLKNENKLCNNTSNCYDVIVDLNYNRLFSMASNETIFPRFSYFVKVKKNNKLTFSYHKINQIIDGSIVGDFSSLSKIGSTNANPEEEHEHIKLISNEISDLLLKAHK